MPNTKALMSLRLLSKHDSLAMFYSVYDRDIYTKCRSLFENKPRDANIIITISEKYNCVYFGVPKAATGMVKTTLQRLASDGSAKGMKKEKRSSSPFNHRRKINYYLHSDDVFRFTVVRNPFTRILSCYFDKILSERRTQFLGLGLKNYLRNRQLDFPEFLSLVREQSPEEMDIHWRPQVDLVQPDKINYGAIGRVETLNDDMIEILNKIGAFEEAEARKTMKWTPRASREIENYIGVRERDIIREVYADDFRAFGYSMDLPHLP